MKIVVKRKKNEKKKLTIRISYQKSHTKINPEQRTLEKEINQNTSSTSSKIKRELKRYGM